MTHASPLAVLLLLAPAFSQESPAGELFAGAPRSFLGARPERTLIDDNHLPGVLELKLAHGMDARLQASGRLASGDPRMAGISEVLDELGAVRERIWLQSDESLVGERLLAEARSGKPLHDLTQFFRIRLPEDQSVAAACDALNALPGVELAYPLGVGGDPVFTAPAGGSGTPDFQGLQGYRTAAPTGIDADYGNTFAGGWGQGIIIADCETGWTDDHEDIAHAAEGSYVGLGQVFYPWDHGTAVVGELVGEDNGLGVLGICHAAEIRLSSHGGSTTNFASAIQAAVDAVNIGDAVVIEIQCYSGAPSPHPCEYVPSVYAVIEAATASGKHVFAAAGNGNNDLDDAAYGGLFDRTVRDSGAVMCGASNGSSLNKASFSNYGSRLDAHGWGFNVTTAAYGDLQGGSATREYTSTFSGTSSATPIVTGAGVILASIFKSAYGTPLDPLVLRDALTATGTPQGSGGQIGPRPNLRAAIPFMGLPHIEVEGPQTIGSSYDIVQHGVPGDLSVLAFSGQLAPAPYSVGVYGELFLGGPISRVLTIPLDAQGESRYTDSIPNDSALIGSTIGYYQGWQRFQTQSGVAHFTNRLSVVVQ